MVCSTNGLSRDASKLLGEAYRKEAAEKVAVTPPTLRWWFFYWDVAGDTSISGKARADFFAAWKDADSGLPILIEAERGYEKR